MRAVAVFLSLAACGGGGLAATPDAPRAPADAAAAAFDGATGPDAAAAFDGATGPDAAAPAVACDETLAAAYRQTDTMVLLVHAFAKGEPLVLAQTPDAGASSAATAHNDVCLVKLLVGPGNPGPGPACPSSCPGPSCPPCTPSTSPGIGIEVWLPAPGNWNGRIHNLGGAHWAGGDQGAIGLIGDTGPAVVATMDNGAAVSGSTDTGHAIQDGSFAMDPDGGIATAQWTDFSERSLHELALQTKALAALYYGRPATRAYWDGCSTGGRQGYNIAQNHPTDYDGYLIGAPAINWTRFETGAFFDQIVIQRDLVDPELGLTTAQEVYVSQLAIAACDVVAQAHLGYLLDPRTCAYDPATDPQALCSATNHHPGCVGPGQAAAIDKFWYGQTADGSVPDPSADNGAGTDLAAGQLWFGQTRGTDLGLRANPGGPYPYSSDQIALELGDPTLAETSFMNASGDGAAKWTGLSYGALAGAAAQGLALQSQFGGINTDSTDLSGVRDAGAKIIHYHGLADPLITPLGSIRYYTQMAAKMGGVPATQGFDRLYLIPGMGHCSGSGTVGLDDGSLPLPGEQQFFLKLVDWVEHDNAPGAVVLQARNNMASRPVCVYPRMAVYAGPDPATAADLAAASSYSCQ